jgi:hypothetical protein
MLNYIQFVASELVLPILKFLIIKLAKLHSNTNGNSHTVRSDHCIIISLLMVIVNEMLYAAHFASKPKNHY